MSQATRTAVVTALLADATLDALLARDPNDPLGVRAALLWGNANQAPPVYPSLTYRIEAEAPDSRFRPARVGDGRPTVVDEYFEFEVWTQTPDSGPKDSIADRIEAVMENQALPFADGSGRIYRAEKVTGRPDLWDKDLNCYFGLYRYRLRVRLTP